MFKLFEYYNVNWNNMPSRYFWRHISANILSKLTQIMNYINAWEDGPATFILFCYVHWEYSRNQRRWFFLSRIHYIVLNYFTDARWQNKYLAPNYVENNVSQWKRNIWCERDSTLVKTPKLLLKETFQKKLFYNSWRRIEFLLGWFPFEKWIESYFCLRFSFAQGTEVFLLFF